MMADPLSFVPKSFPYQCLDVLVNRYNEGHRNYHDLEHIATIWADHLAHGGDPADTVILHATLYHDAVYDVHRTDNEDKSNSLFLQHLPILGLSFETALKVSECIKGSGLFPLSVKWPDAPPHVQWFCDLDLLGLAKSYDVFKANGQRIRNEYGFVPEKLFREQRQAFYQTLLQAPAIYLTPSIHDQYELAARANLERGLEQLGLGFLS